MSRSRVYVFLLSPSMAGYIEMLCFVRKADRKRLKLAKIEAITVNEVRASLKEKLVMVKFRRPLCRAAGFFLFLHETVCVLRKSVICDEGTFLQEVKLPICHGLLHSPLLAYQTFPLSERFIPSSAAIKTSALARCYFSLNTSNCATPD